MNLTAGDLKAYVPAANAGSWLFADVDARWDERAARVGKLMICGDEVADMLPCAWVPVLILPEGWRDWFCWGDDLL